MAEKTTIRLVACFCFFVKVLGVTSPPMSSSHCTPVHTCVTHTCRGEASRCVPGWMGNRCSVQIAGGEGDCSVYDTKAFIPSEWKGNYTCASDNKRITFVMNITKSSDSIGTVGDLLIQTHRISMKGGYASFLSAITLQNNESISEEIAGQSFTNIELNGVLHNPVYIKGAVIFTADGGTKAMCPMELRRTAVYVNWCNYHGSCYRYGREKSRFACCCDYGYTGQFCENELATSSKPTIAYTTTTSPTTTPVSVSTTTSKTTPGHGSTTTSNTTPGHGSTTTPKTTPGYGSVCPDGWLVFRGSCYLFSDEIQVDWIEGTHLCATHNAHLAVIETHAEDVFIKDHALRLFKNVGDRHHSNVAFWIGGSDEEIEGIWAWYTDHTEISYTSWHPGEPDNRSNQDCLLLWGSYDFEWGSYYCGEKEHVICEMEYSGGQGVLIG